MNNQLQIIDQRTVLEKDFRIYGTKEKPLFLAKDIAEWIEHSNVAKMIEDAQLDEDELIKDFIEITYSYGNDFRTRKQEVFLLTEDGLYEVLLQSKKPIARVFRKEVKMILKSIRLNGMYATDELLDNSDLLVEIAAKLKLEKEARIEAEREKVILQEQNKKQAKQISEQAHKAEYFDKVLETKNLITTTAIAKELGMGAARLNKILHEYGVIYKSNDIYFPYSKYGYLTAEGYARYDIYYDNDNNKTRRHLKWTEKGHKWVIDFLRQKNIINTA